mmetsp:Transcript_5943/g.11609  ORF Transcript_5943/g.11609 Transcript_5943/m.11609 type:complete len:290 (+) Transcript_5943:200-1069(+)
MSLLNPPSTTDAHPIIIRDVVPAPDILPFIRLKLPLIIHLDFGTILLHRSRRHWKIRRGIRNEQRKRQILACHGRLSRVLHQRFILHVFSEEFIGCQHGLADDQIGQVIVVVNPVFLRVRIPIAGIQPHHALFVALPARSIGPIIHHPRKESRGEEDVVIHQNHRGVLIGIRIRRIESVGHPILFRLDELHRHRVGFVSRGQNILGQIHVEVVPNEEYLVQDAGHLSIAAHDPGDLLEATGGVGHEDEGGAAGVRDEDFVGGGADGLAVGVGHVAGVFGEFAEEALEGG